MLLSLTRRTDLRVSVELFNDEGNVIYQSMVNRFKDKDVGWLARLCNFTPQEITTQLNAVCETKEEGEYEPVTMEVDPPETMLDSIRGKEPSTTSNLPYAVSVRDLSQPRQYATAYTDCDPGEALQLAMLNGAIGDYTEPLIEWGDRERLCVLDVDYHNVPKKQRPKLDVLTKTLSRVRPQPYCWHPSHAGGAKLYYVSRPGIFAEELAAVAGVSWVQVDPRATFDLMKSSRHPCFPRARDHAPAPVADPQDITYTYGGGDLSLLHRLLATELNEEAITELLYERGWTIGENLPHSQCPLDPGGSSDETKLSVHVGDRGLYCHRCHGRGLGIGGSGFVPYVTLTGGTDSRVANMARHFCHLEHARVVLANIYPTLPPPILDLLYRAMLKILHREDPRIDFAMSAGKGFVRTRGQWVSATGTTTVGQGLKEYVRSLPAVLTPNDRGFTINIPRQTAFLNAGDLGELGYPDITFIRGCRIANNISTGEVFKVITRPEFRDTPPRYLPQSKRMKSRDAWRLLDEEFAGIDHAYVKLLIAAKGAAEGRLAQCPFLLITGPAGSGKSTTPHIAAGICGDKVEEPVWVPHPERFRAALMDSARETSFVVINEIFKSADQNRLSHVQALNPMLSLTEDSRSHVLYVGSVPFGRLPVFVLTDVNVPREVEGDIQITRRFTYLRLSSRCYWDDTFIGRGIRPHEYRLISPDHAASADAILSEVIDEFFSSPMSLRDIATALGSAPMESGSDDTVRKAGIMKAFFMEVCNAPTLTGSDATRYAPHRGWKRIDRIAQNKLNDLWAELNDSASQEQWQLSRTCDAEDWAKVLELDFPVVCDIKPYQTSAVYVRFRSADSSKEPRWVNGKVVDL